MKKKFVVKVTLKRDFGVDAGSQDLANILLGYNGKTFLITEENGRRLINGSAVPTSNSLETDITNMILILEGHGSITYNQEPYFTVETVT